MKEKGSELEGGSKTILIAHRFWILFLNLPSPASRPSTTNPDLWTLLLTTGERLCLFLATLHYIRTKIEQCTSPKHFAFTDEKQTPAWFTFSSNIQETSWQRDWEGLVKHKRVQVFKPTPFGKSHEVMRAKSLVVKSKLALCISFTKCRSAFTQGP